LCGCQLRVIGAQQISAIQGCHLSPFSTLLCKQGLVITTNS
jgi:hypothetical protein